MTQDAHLRSGDGDADGFQVAQFAHQDHIRIFTQGGVQRVRERRRVQPDLALADQAVTALVHELDGILDGEDVALVALVDVIDHRGKRRGLARTCLAGDPGSCRCWRAPACARIPAA